MEAILDSFITMSTIKNMLDKNQNALANNIYNVAIRHMFFSKRQNTVWHTTYADSAPHSIRLKHLCRELPKLASDINFI